MSERGSGGRGRSDTERNERVTSHLWLAQAIARQFAWLAPKTIDGDVLGPAYEGLVKAGDGYRPEAGDFVAYARKWILGEIFQAADRKTPGFTRRYGPAADLLDDLAENMDEGGGEPLDHAAVVMCIGSESLRRAHGEPSGLGGVIDEELARFPAAQRAVFLGRVVDGATWPELVAEAGIRLGMARRWVNEVQAALVQRLKRKHRG